MKIIKIREISTGKIFDIFDGIYKENYEKTGKYEIVKKLESR